MKFYHLSDILIGNNFETGMRWEETRTREILESLEGVLARAESEGVDLILITGGLFHHPPVTAELREVSALFAAHPGLRIVITAGASDAITGSSPVLSFTFPDNVYLCVGPGVETVTLEDLSAEIVAGSAWVGKDGKISWPGVSDFSGASDSGAKVRIAMLPKLSNDEIRELADSGNWSYIAAAGEGEGVNREIVRKLAYRPGRFEPRDSADRGAHGAMAGEISRDSGKLAAIDFLPLALASYVTLNVRLSPRTDIAKLKEAIEAEIRRRRASNIYRLRITGLKDPGMDIDLDELKATFRIREIIDEAVPSYDYEALYHEHSEDMIGYFIGSFYGREDKMSVLEKKAMFYGMEALLETASSDKDI